jgi:uncharacterized membrane protein (DUF2068 family)
LEAVFTACDDLPEKAKSMADIHQTGIVTHAVARRRALRTIGIFEAAKGIAAMAGTVGLLRLVHHDIRVQLADIIEHLGMRPNSHYPAILLRYADLLHNADLRWLLLLAIGYAMLRFFESYGLWHNLAWGEWLGVLSGAIYIPIEISRLAHLPTVPGYIVFAGNVIVVAFLAIQLWRRRRRL